MRFSEDSSSARFFSGLFLADIGDKAVRKKVNGGLEAFDGDWKVFLYLAFIGSILLRKAFFRFG